MQKNPVVLSIFITLGIDSEQKFKILNSASVKIKVQSILPGI